MACRHRMYLPPPLGQEHADPPARRRRRATGTAEGSGDHKPTAVVLRGVLNLIDEVGVRELTGRERYSAGASYDRPGARPKNVACFGHDDSRSRYRSAFSAAG
ncbi:helix-turn-helix domain-containing protein [Aquamicrobium terrae]|uniref:helix-turn-helix domain-containing protein n=1 Tax=Aquamicrobium terrae TaxID=1324945 RepID=UPI003396BD8F